MELAEAISEVTKFVREGQDNARQLGEIRATLLVNFGTNSKAKDLYGFGIEDKRAENESTLNLLVFVLQELVKLAADSSQQRLEEREACKEIAEYWAGNIAYPISSKKTGQQVAQEIVNKIEKRSK